jgi:hypothetical protein
MEGVVGMGVLGGTLFLIPLSCALTWNFSKITLLSFRYLHDLTRPPDDNCPCWSAVSRTMFLRLRVRISTLLRGLVS